MRSIRFAALGLCLTSALAAGTASAATWPAKVLGRYAGVANTASVLIDITSQGTGTPCVGIAGTLTDTGQGITDPITGYYCPKSGSLAFVRNDPTSGQTFQVYTGSFAVAQSGYTNKLAGTFGEYDAVDNLGLYPFAVTK